MFCYKSGTIINFRDVGVSVNENKRYIKQGMLTRSATLDNLTMEDVNKFIVAYNTKTIIDLRTSRETKFGLAIDKRFPTIKKNKWMFGTTEEKEILLSRYKIRVNFVGSNFKKNIIMASSTFQLKIILFVLFIFCQIQWAQYLVSRSILNPMGIVNLYQNFITYCSDELKEALLLFTEEKNYPIHVHCTQGKDRTGLVIFFILSICQVPEDLIINDYAKTQDGLAIVYDEMLDDVRRNGLSDEFMDASPKNLRQLIDHINQHYGSVENYLIDIGIDLELQSKIRNILCEFEQ